MNRRAYDTSVKHLFRLNLENSIPMELLTTIPRTNIHRWRNESHGKYEGCSLNEIAKEQLELLQAFSEHRAAKRTFNAYLRLFSTCRSIVLKCKDLRSIFHDSREELVGVIQRVQTTIGVQKAVRFFGISRTTFQNWLLETKVKCNHNYFGWCNRIRPYQLSRPEVTAIHGLVTDERFKYWPISSIFHYANRERTVHTSLSTFYKYVRLLGIRRPKHVKPPPKCGIRAETPHELWHTDVTILKIQGQKLYLHLLMDNFSRYILGWRLEDTLSGLTVRDMLIEALNKYGPEQVRLMVDGGTENNNLEVDEVITGSKGVLQRLIAQKEIDFSNSMVESVNNLIKNSYLRPMGVDDPGQLPDAIGSSINDINHVRPHNAIGGLIPIEALNGMTINTAERQRQLQKARAGRLEYNRKNTCGKCL